VVIGVPCNDFGGKEPGGITEISETTRQYGVTFPVAAKTIVVGHDAHPFYKWAVAARPSDAPHWNFHKYLIGRDGYISDVFPPAVEPANVKVKKAVARSLAYTRSATAN
jgi:glutathione peroxidase